MAYSEDGPSLAVVGINLYAIWRGHQGGDKPEEQLWWSKTGPLEGGGKIGRRGSDTAGQAQLIKCYPEWVKPGEIPDAGTSHRPSIAKYSIGQTADEESNTEDRTAGLVAVWKAPQDESIHFSTFNCAEETWKKRSLKTSFGSKAGPAITSWGRSGAWAVWCGIYGDELLWRAPFDGSAQKPWGGGQRPDYFGMQTRHRPALVSFDGRLYLAWLSSAPETVDQILFSSCRDSDQDLGMWEKPISVHSHCHSSAAPSLATFKGRVYVTWRGKGKDQGVWLMLCVRPGETTLMEHPQRLEGASTTSTPSLAEWEGKLVLVWKGMNDDRRLWWGMLDLE